jgi:hypothetical protein
MNISTTSPGLRQELYYMYNKRLMPSIFICEPNRLYNGLFLYLIPRHKIMEFDNFGMLVSDVLLKQEKSMQQLEMKGYKASFSVGSVQTRQIIIDYMNNR